tara:strand:+ start:666 stop:878 length:213 start_codon:yes stop_codon:yes gene_type:complete
MSYRKPIKFKNKPKWRKFTYHNGVKYEVLNIGGTEMEIRVAGEKEQQEAKQMFQTYRKNKKQYFSKYDRK